MRHTVFHRIGYFTLISLACVACSSDDPDDSGAAGSSGSAGQGGSGEGGSSTVGGAGGATAGSAGNAAGSAGIGGIGGTTGGAGGTTGGAGGTTGGAGGTTGGAGGTTGGAGGTANADIQPPSVDYYFPPAGHAVRSRLALVLGDVSDDVGVTDVQLKAADGSLHAATLSGGEFRGLVPVTPGLNAIEILVSDAAGNTTTQATSAFYGQLTGAGAAHSGALVHDKVYVWGKNNEGQAGIGGVTSLGDSGHPAAPVELTFSEPLVQLQFSQNSSFALSSSGNVWAWGDNDSGQLGLGADDPNTLDEAIRTSPEQVSGVSNVTSIARGYDHTLLLLTDGTVLAFGENGKGQLGTGGTEDSDTPTAVPGLTDIVQLAAGSASSYALDASGKLYAWGRNQYGNLANATSDTDAHDTPMEITGLPPLVQLACGRDHVLALDETGKLWGWGLNSSNQVGQYDTAVWGSPLTTPVELPWNSDVVMVHAQANQSFIELRGGRILGWGQNVNGSLGVATDEDLPEPIEPVFALDRLLDVGVGALHGVAMRNDGAVFAWGWSSEGSLGGGEGTIDRWSYRVPILVIAP